MTTEADHGGNMLAIDSRGFGSRMCVCRGVLFNLHVQLKETCSVQIKVDSMRMIL